ncbi:hypothetical protein B0H14DRAFT_3742017 [Mycena olivaceomarginata]|nr:hypothetical protein B0H14DRAFT_3742017 [Mycena olivaceomarginata]
MELQHDLDELFYATFPNARPSLHSALVEVEHARIFMPPELRERFFGAEMEISVADTHRRPAFEHGIPSASATMKPRDKKLPACLFCRKQKIACAPALGVCRGAMNAQAQCNQCYRRRLDCVYPTERQRGTKKKQPSTLTRTAVESQVSTNGGGMDTMREPLTISFVMPVGSIVRTTSGSSDRGEMEHGKDGA